jgi:outer membrane protein assembly factor BamA
VRATWSVSLLLALAFLVGACNENETVQVHSLTFKGVMAVNETRLRNALAIRESSKLPWGRKRFFDKARFETDLKRIEAFYNDRGYPDVRVTGVDLKMNARQTAVDITVTLDEGKPVTVVAIQLYGFETVPPEHVVTLRNNLPLKVGAARDRQVVVTAREMAANELKDHGYPYGKVSTDEDDGSDRSKTLIQDPFETLTAES